MPPPPRAPASKSPSADRDHPEPAAVPARLANRFPVPATASRSTYASPASNLRCRRLPDAHLVGAHFEIVSTGFAARPRRRPAARGCHARGGFRGDARRRGRRLRAAGSAALSRCPASSSASPGSGFRSNEACAAHRGGFTLAESSRRWSWWRCSRPWPCPLWRMHLLRVRRTEAIDALIALQAAQDRHFGRHARYADSAQLTAPAPEGSASSRTPHTVSTTSAADQRRRTGLPAPRRARRARRPGGRHALRRVLARSERSAARRGCAKATIAARTAGTRNCGQSARCVRCAERAAARTPRALRGPSAPRPAVPPHSRRRATTCCTSSSGAEAPAVTPTALLPSNHSRLRNDASSMR